MRHDNFIQKPRFVKIRSRGRLPHWEVDDAIYSVTIRLRDSIPRHIAEGLVAERARAVSSLKTDSQRADYERVFGRRVDHYLNAGYGSCILRHDRNAAIVANALKHFDGVRYVLHAWCVMPNHVHAMFHVQYGREVPRILHSWKSYTAHEIEQGVIWQREYVDRVVRGDRDYADTKTYILRNPDGLMPWPWVGGLA